MAGRHNETFAGAVGNSQEKGYETCLNRGERKL